MKEDTLLKKAQAIREEEHRLKPSLRLKTLDEIVEFVHSKGLVSELGGNELPSLVSALLGRPWKPTGKGFTSWLEWWDLRVSGRRVAEMLEAISRRADMVETRIFRKTKTLVSKRLWTALDPIVRHYSEIARKHEIFSQLEWKILDTILDNGPTRTDRLRAIVKIEGKENTAKFHRALARLENHALIVGYQDPKPEKHIHAAIWQLWDQRIARKAADPELSYEKALAVLLTATVDAALLVQETDVGRLFPWNGRLKQVKDELVVNGRILRVGSSL